MEIPSAELDLMGAVSSSQLPADVMMEILIRLPVKSVLRFKSVCRAWNALSNNPLFIKLHCQMAVTSSNKSPVLRLLVHTRDSSELHHVLSVLLHPPYDQPIIRKLNPPIEYSSYSLDVVGSINGVVCLNLSDHAGCILLWNPATRKHYQIPRPALVLTYDERVTLGFGYDTKSNSFKVVRVVYAKHFSANMQRARIEVYSTQTNSWSSKGSDDLPWLCYQKRCSIIVRGSPYWYAVELQQQGSIFRELVAWFDMDSERFFFHTLPYYSNFSSFRIQLGVLEGNPAVAVYSTGSDPDRKVEIWMLDKYGSSGRDNNEMTWVRKFSINPIVGVEKVVGCGKNCEILAEDQDGVLYVYNPSPTEIKDLPHYRSWGFTDVYDHVESLVAVSPSTEA